MDYVVVGTGRGGTGYMSHLLRHNGIACGHEQVCNWRNDDYGLVIRDTTWQAESSWFVAPQLARIEECNPNLIALHVWRDPVLVVKSFLDQGQVIEECKSLQYIAKYLQHQPGQNYVDFFTRYWITWHNMIIESTINKLVVPLHDINIDRISTFLGREMKPFSEVVNTKSNAKKHNYSYTEIEDRIISTGLRAEVDQMLCRLEEYS